MGGGDASGMCTGRARLKAGAPRARAERTPNMKRMFVTLEVSKLSGWLNADADCGVERRACDARRGTAREAPWRWVAATQSACAGRARLKAGEDRARAERTQNMPSMFVTLEVSKLSGWLNADAYCRGSKAGHAVGGEVCGSAGGRRRATAAASSVQERARLQRLGAGHGRSLRTPNMADMSVTLEVSKLSGWLNADAP